MFAAGPHSRIRTLAYALGAASLAACAGRPVTGAALAPSPATSSLVSDRTCLAPNAVRWEVARGQTRTLGVWLGSDVAAHDRRRTTMRSQLRAALDEWNALGLPLRLAFSPSRAGSEIRVEVIDRFPLDPTAPGSSVHGGLTHLQHTETGAIGLAELFLAETTPRGIPFSGEDWRAILLHELGHALGLPHTARGYALMAASPIVSSVTPIDAALARALYQRQRCEGTLAATTVRSSANAPKQ